MNYGKLFIVATPIGNLGDMTVRALEILKTVDLILTEDSRVSSRMLSHYDIKRGILIYHHHSDEKKKFEVLSRLIEGKDIALITDAGTPGIADPGNELIDFILEREPNIKIIPIPGASAITSALSVSGFNTGKFVFLGFLPKKKRTKLFNWLKEGTITFAFFESPKRVLNSLEVIRDFFGVNSRVCVTRELTKMYETVYRGKIDEVINLLSKNLQKGEFTVIIEL